MTDPSELGYLTNHAALQAQYAQEPKVAKPARHLLQELRSTFTLEPFQDVTAHFAGLQKYTEALRLPDPTEWARKHGV